MTQSPRATMSLPDIVAAAFTHYTRNLGVFLSLALPGAAIAGLLNAESYALLQVSSFPLFQIGAHSRINDVTQLGAKLLLAELCGFAATVVGAIWVGLLVCVALDVALGRKLRPADTVRVFVPLIPTVLAATFIFGLVIGAVAATIVGLPVAIFVAVRWVLCTEVICAERAGPIDSLRRSWRLTVGLWWHTASVELAIVLLGLLPTIVVQPIVGAFNSLPATTAARSAAEWLAMPSTRSAPRCFTST